MNYYEEIKHLAPQVIGMTEDEAIDFINNENHNCVIISIDDKQYNKLNTSRNSVQIIIKDGKVTESIPFTEE
jgi:hypothetical protein